jgi:hypothetical protein
MSPPINSIATQTQKLMTTPIQLIDSLINCLVLLKSSVNPLVFVSLLQDFAVVKSLTNQNQRTRITIDKPSHYDVISDNSGMCFYSYCKNAAKVVKISLCSTIYDLCETAENFKITRADLMETLDFISTGQLREETMTYEGPYGIEIDMYRITIPYWFELSIISHVKDYHSHFFSIENVNEIADLIDFFDKLTFVESHTLTMKTAKQKLTLGTDLDRNIKILLIKRLISGQKVQIENISRSILSARNNTHNNISVAQLQKNKTECEYRLMNFEERLSALLFEQLRSPIESQPCMESPNEVSQTVDDAENTGIADTAIETVTHVIAVPQDTMLAAELFADNVHSYPDLTGRWQKVKSFTIDRDTVAGTTFLLHLPADFLSSNWQSPNCLPFRTHEFFTGGMELKFQWNIPKTNQFHVKIGFVPHWLQRDRKEELLEYGPVSQQPGGRLNGHLANSTVIDIPYMSYSALIPIRPNTVMLNQYYATIIVKAFTDYGISTGGVSSSELICYLKFKSDLRFYGQRETIDEYPGFVIPTRATIESQPCMGVLALAGASLATSAKGAAVNALSGILSGLVQAANNVVSGGVKAATGALLGGTERLLSKALPPRHNQDKPTDLHNVVFHQRATTNLASGSGEFHADSLRLESTGLTPHPDFLMGIEKYDNISDVIETFGFVNSVRVLDFAPAEGFICSIDVNPCAIPIVEVGNNFPNGMSEWTPLDHMAGWFQNHHGQTQFKFECVSDGFKTCRILVAYIPNASVESHSYNAAKSSYYKTFDLGGDLDTQ